MPEVLPGNTKFLVQPFGGKAPSRFFCHMAEDGKGVGCGFTEVHCIIDGAKVVTLLEYILPYAFGKNQAYFCNKDTCSLLCNILSLNIGKYEAGMQYPEFCSVTLVL